MSGPAYRYAMQVGRDKRLPAPTRLFLLALADHANRTTGESFPSWETLEDDTGLSRRSIATAAAAVEAAGILEARHRGNRPTVWTFPAHARYSTPYQPPPRRPVENRRRRPIAARPRVQDVHPDLRSQGAGDAPESITYVVGNNTRGAAHTRRPPPFDSSALVAAITSQIGGGPILDPDDVAAMVERGRGVVEPDR